MLSTIMLIWTLDCLFITLRFIFINFMRCYRRIYYQVCISISLSSLIFIFSLSLKIILNAEFLFVFLKSLYDHQNHDLNYHILLMFSNKIALTQTKLWFYRLSLILRSQQFSLCLMNFFLLNTASLLIMHLEGLRLVHHSLNPLTPLG